MVTTLRATFDGKVLVPDGAVDLRINTPLVFDVRVEEPGRRTAAGPFDVARVGRPIPAEPRCGDRRGCPARPLPVRHAQAEEPVTFVDTGFLVLRQTR